MVRMSKPAMRKAARVAKAVYKTAKKDPSLNSMMKETQKKFMRELPTLAAVTHEAIKLSKKVPVDSSSGKSLNTQKYELVETGAVKGTSESYSMYAFRRPRKLSPGAIKVEAISSIVDVDCGCDPNKRGYKNYMFLAAEPAINDTPTNDSFYKFTIREFFDKLPKMVYELDGTNIETNQGSQMIHLGSLTNQTTVSTPTGCVVDIYDLVPRFDIGGATRVTQFGGTGYGAPSWCVEQGNSGTEYINLNETLQPMEDWDSIQFNPETSQTFNRVWKVVKKTRLMTTDGAVHRHNSVFGLNKTITYQKMAQASTSGQLFGGICPCQMIVISGYPTSTEYSNGISTADIRFDFKLDYHVIPDQGGKYFFQGRNAIA